jgi:hypothetical protein
MMQSRRPVASRPELRRKSSQCISDEPYRDHSFAVERRRRRGLSLCFALRIVGSPRPLPAGGRALGRHESRANAGGTAIVYARDCPLPSPADGALITRNSTPRRLREGPGGRGGCEAPTGMRIAGAAGRPAVVCGECTVRRPRAAGCVSQRRTRPWRRSAAVGTACMSVQRCSGHRLVLGGNRRRRLRIPSGAPA